MSAIPRRSLHAFCIILLLALSSATCKNRMASRTIADPGGSYHIEWVEAEAPATMKAKEVVPVRFSFRNAGDQPISSDLLAVSYHWMDAADPKRIIVWDGSRTAVGQAIAPGESFSGALAVRAPDLPGRYMLDLDVVREGVAWFSSRGSPLSHHPVTVE